MSEYRLDFRGAKKGHRIKGDLRTDIGMRLTWHWADNGRRMYKCTCMPMFRVGGKFKSPMRGAGYRKTYGKKGTQHFYGKAWRTRVQPSTATPGSTG